MNKPSFTNKRVVNKCYDHIGGLLGEVLLNFLLKEKWINKDNEEEVIVTEKGMDELEIIGVDVLKLNESDRKPVNICHETNQGILYEHIGSNLGALLTSRLVEMGWLTERDNKSYELTEKGQVGLESLGIKLKTIVSK